MAIQYTQTLISLKRLIEKQSNESLAKIIKQENDNAGALILALSSPENRSETTALALCRGFLVSTFFISWTT